MSAVFAQRVVVGETGEPGVGLISIADARLKPGDVVEIEVHAVRAQQGSGPLLKRTRTLALDLPVDYSTNFEPRL